jgi:dUTP pyrophosphatase|tara:strand:- start:496 stop:966 length:471 start_codon:yes stop_codon:yes gene_type:complete
MDFIRLYIKTDGSKFYQSKINLDGDAGVDLFFPNMVRVPKGETMLIDFEINCKMVHVHEIELGHLYEEPTSFMLVPRSSIFRTPLRQANNIGIIDSGYRGRIMVPVDNRSNEDYIIKPKERLFQLVHPSLKPISIELVSELDDTKRGSGGFGSTGK